MNKNRLEAFSDGVLAIAITIMVLNLKVPLGTGWTEISAITPLLSSYLLSFIYVGIYWVNHHHLMQPVRSVNGLILWANLHLLFWLSLIPFVTAWVSVDPSASPPVAIYGLVLLMSSFAFLLLGKALLAKEGENSRLAIALGNGRKNQISIFLYAAAILLSLWSGIGGLLVYAAVAILWFVPDRRIESLRWD
ncbi:TMEM175 family protein [Paraherbaspirillum soli]|uniref:TMEM175 family protein n=1 Tax=Paraherbaspirillum soli TaxID=631222 RepID=A0ABW0MCI2_9BURK